jgi:hypothetical protein
LSLVLSPHETVPRIDCDGGGTHGFGIKRGRVHACKRPSEIAEGSLSQKTFEDANGRPEKAFILTMPVPTCLSGADESDNVKSSTTIHIYSSNDAVAKSIKKFVGKPVEVHGSAFGAITAHHHAPIVMDISDIDEI